MDATHAPFLRAIRATPDDDLPRLIYADYLDECGDPRGEFIRVQCAVARTSTRDPEYLALKRREAELLRDYRDDWEGPLAAVVSRAVFRRGFIDELLVMADAFLAHAEEIVAWAPVRSLKLRGVFGFLRRIVARPELAELAALDVGFEHLDSRDAVLLAECPYLVGLRSLNLNGNPVGDDGAAALARSATLTGLEELHLEHTGVRARGAALMTRDRFPNLRRLELSDNPLGDAVVDGLIAGRCLERFAALDLTSVLLTDAGATRLAESPAAHGLHRLRLGYNALTDVSAQALAASPHLIALRALDLNGNAIGDAGAAAILAAPHLRRLTRLGIAVNPLSRATRDRLDGAFGDRWG